MPVVKSVSWMSPLYLALGPLLTSLLWAVLPPLGDGGAEVCSDTEFRLNAWGTSLMGRGALSKCPHCMALVYRRQNCRVEASPPGKEGLFSSFRDRTLITSTGSTAFWGEGFLGWSQGFLEPSPHPKPKEISWRLWLPLGLLKGDLPEGL